MQTVVLAGRTLPALLGLRERALALEHAHTQDLEHIDPFFRDSACNLLHYLALRQVDLRPIQTELTALGLNSLGRIEAHVMSSLNAVLVAASRLAGRDWLAPAEQAASADHRTGPLLLREHTRTMFGTPSGKREQQIMVTMPSEAAAQYNLVRDLLAAGMDVMRINCAHDSPSAWLAMIEHARRASRELGRSCKIYADLAGPKLRTGSIAPAGRIVRVTPKRNVRGMVLTAGRFWLTPAAAPESCLEQTVATVPVDGDVVSSASPGDHVRLIDTRGRERLLIVTEVMGRSVLAECDFTTYLETGLPLQLLRDDEVIGEGIVGLLPELVLPLQLFNNDLLLVTREDVPGRNAERDEAGNVVQPAQIPCTLDAVFDSVRADERIWFDDGKIGGVVVANDGATITVRITQAGPNGARLRSEKGINLPDTELNTPALTEKDLVDLEFLIKYVDIIGMSFVRHPRDVFELESHLERLHAGGLGIVLKIETRQAFENLPLLLLASLCSPPVGVMVARGDLAVEVGFERLAEVQEEVLWLCEAAHIPVIWATQVLEGMASRGAPTRAEVSDAVMSGRAECVMLNKGPFIVETVRFLSGILERMDAHQAKQRAMLRRLSVSDVPSSFWA